MIKISLIIILEFLAIQWIKRTSPGIWETDRRSILFWHALILTFLF